MRRFSFLAALLAVLLTGTPSFAGPPPYLKLAEAVGTPHLADSEGPADKSRLVLKFVPAGQSVKDWKKMTTVSILKLPPNDVNDAATQSALRGVIRTLKDDLKVRKVKIETFDESPLEPATCYFEYSDLGETQKGVVYSPERGFITIAQIGSKDGGDISDGDVDLLRHIIAQR